jgi:hypothetical protein
MTDWTIDIPAMPDLGNADQAYGGHITRHNARTSDDDNPGGSRPLTDAEWAHYTRHGYLPTGAMPFVSAPPVSDWQPPPPQPPRTLDPSVFDDTRDTVVVETQGVNGGAGVPTRVRTPRPASGKIKIAVPQPDGTFQYRWVARDDHLVHPVARHG